MTGVFSQKEQNIQKQGSRLEEQPQFTADELKELKEEFQIPVTDRYPVISKKLIEIKDNLVNSFIEEDFSYLPPALRERMEQYQKILSESNLRIVLSESDQVNAFHIVGKGIIIVNKGIIREAIDQGLGEDAIAFVIGHEISHLLYEKYSTWKKSQLNNHDMEYQCDKDAVTLMDVAGYNPCPAMVFNIEEKGFKYDFGLLISHPDETNRHNRIREAIENGVWKNFSNDMIHDFPSGVIQEINREGKISRPLMELQRQFKEHFISELEKKLEDAIKSPDNYAKKNTANHQCISPEIPPIYKERFKSFLSDLKNLHPDYVNVAEEIFLSAERKAISCVPKSDPYKDAYELVSIGFHSKLRDYSHRQLLEIIKNYVPPYREARDGALYDPFPVYVRGIIRKYQDEVNERLIHAKNLLDPDLIALTKECIGKMGIGFMNIRMKGAILNILDFNQENPSKEQLGDFLEQLGSRNLVLLVANCSESPFCFRIDGKKDRTIEILRKNKFCAQILDETFDARLKNDKRVDLSFISYREKIKLLRSRDCSEWIKGQIIIDDILPKLKTKEIQPLDLLMVFNVIKESELKMFFKNSAAQRRSIWKMSDEERKLLPREKRYSSIYLALVDGMDKYTEGEDEKVKSFWREQILSIGVFPEVVKSIQELTECLSYVPSDLPTLDRNLCLQSGDYTPPNDKVLAVPTEMVNAAKGTIKCFDLYDLSQIGGREKFVDTIWNALDYKLTEQQAFDLARCFTKIGYDTLVNEGFFFDLDNVSKFWKEASPHKIYRSVPENLSIDLYEVFSWDRDGAYRKLPQFNTYDTGNIDLSQTDKIDVSKNCLTEPIGNMIEFRDFVFLRYLKETEFSDLYFDKKEDAIKWVENYLPRKCEFRDIVLANIFEMNDFDKELSNKENKEFFLKFLSLFSESRFRREAFSGKIYQAFRDDTQIIDEKMKFILNCFPYSKITRDEIIDDMLEKHLKYCGATMEDFDRVFNYYSSCDREFAKKSSILDGTLGAFVHNCKIEDKFAIAEWLFLGEEKPYFVTQNEYTSSHVKLDFLPDLMASNELRHKMMEILFLGENGIAAKGKEIYLYLFIDHAFDKYFQVEEGSDQGKNKFLSFARIVVKETLFNVDTYKREKLLSRMFDLIKDESTKNIETFLPKWVAGYSASAVKFLQIVGSRSEVKRVYPELYAICDEVKSNAEGMSFFNMIQSLSTNEEFRNGGYTITDIIGSASIKVVLKAKNKDGDEVAIKVLRQNVGKFVNEEADELRKVVESLKPALKEIWGIESVPDIVGRASKATLDETDLIQEVRNSAVLTDAIRDISTDEYSVTIPTACYEDKNLIVESLGYGQTMDKWLELHPEDSEALAKHTQKIFLSLLNKNIVLADMHQGNILVDKDKSGKFKITLIDTGALFALTDDEAKLYKKAIAGMVLSVMEKKGGRDLLLERISSVTGKSGILAGIARFVLKRKISSESVLSRCVQELVGREIYNLNGVKEKLEAIRESDAVVSKPLQFLEMLDELKYEDGERYLVPNKLYWSLIGLTKPYGLFDYRSDNQELYSEVFRSAIV